MTEKKAQKANIISTQCKAAAWKITNKHFFHVTLPSEMLGEACAGFPRDLDEYRRHLGRVHPVLHETCSSRLLVSGQWSMVTRCAWGVDPGWESSSSYWCKATVAMSFSCRNVKTGNAPQDPAQVMVGATYDVFGLRERELTIAGFRFDSDNVDHHWNGSF